MNPFEVLGLDSKSTPKDIDNAYRDLVKKYHPDINSSPEASNKFKEVQQAYELLKKNNFNSMNFRTRRPPPTGFESFYAGVFSQSHYKGRSVHAQIEIELLEVLNGCQKIIKYKKSSICRAKSCNKGFLDFLECEICKGKGQVELPTGPFLTRTTCYSCAGQGKIGIKKCPECSGTGVNDIQDVEFTVNIEPGVEDGSQLVFSSQGEESLYGGIKGDLVVDIKIKEHLFFKREGANLNIEVPISYSTLCLGGNIEVPTLSKEIVSVKIPEGCQLYSKFRVKNKGLFYKGKTGDMIISLKLEVPKNIDKSYRNIISNLEKMEKKWPSATKENWLKYINNEKEEI